MFPVGKSERSILCSRDIFAPGHELRSFNEHLARTDPAPIHRQLCRSGMSRPTVDYCYLTYVDFGIVFYTIPTILIRPPSLMLI